MPPKARARADELVFAGGLAESREKAKRLIMAGRVRLAGSPGGEILKPGRLCPADTKFILEPGQEFVSRGAYKLITLLDGFHIDVSGMVCLDAGASTGGFTDCLLQRGAARVYAVDVGEHQLHEKLRADRRVVSMEGVNLRHAPSHLLPEKVDFLCGDLSFISLTLVLPACVRWLKPSALVAALIKPQFELGPGETVKGVVRDEAARQKAVNKVTGFCQEKLDLELKGVLPAAIKGPKGNQEYMALFRGPSSM